MKNAAEIGSGAMIYETSFRHSNGEGRFIDRDRMVIS
jgi:hypothetical protein